jgi:hypothetical protein
MGLPRLQNSLWIQNKRFTLLERNVLMGTPCRCSARAYGHSLKVFSARDLKHPLNWNSHLEFLWPSSTSYSSMVILLFKDEESYVDPESSYAPSRRVSGCPSTKFGVRIPLKTQALPATADITPGFLLTSVGLLASTITYHRALECYWWTSAHHRVLSSTPPWRLPTSCYLPIHPRWCIVHSRPFLTHHISFCYFPTVTFIIILFKYIYTKQTHNRLRKTSNFNS